MRLSLPFIQSNNSLSYCALFTFISITIDTAALSIPYKHNIYHKHIDTYYSYSYWLLLEESARLFVVL